MTDIEAKRSNLTEAQRALLEKRLKGKKQARNTEKPAQIIQKRPDDAPLVASAGQRRLWVLHQLNPNSAAYNMVNAVRIRGPLDANRLQASFKAVIDRHEVLRTSFHMQDGILNQHIHDNVAFSLSQHTASDDDDAVDTLVRSIAQRPFDLSQAPLIRATLIELTPDEAVLVTVIHHIVCDEWSVDVLWKETAAHYTGKGEALPELPIQYADYAHWQHKQQENNTYESQIAYWQEKLSGELPLLQLPTDFVRPGIQQFAGALLQYNLSPALSQSIHILSRDSGTTPFMTLLAAFTVLLHRYTNQDDILVGAPVANRKYGELENLIGFFLNTAVLRCNFETDRSFSAYLQEIREQSLSTIAQSDVPFDIVVDTLNPPRDASYNPVFQAMFVYQDNAAHQPALPGVTLAPMTVDVSVSKFDLTLFCQMVNDRARVMLEYNTQLFKEATIQRLFTHYQTLLESIVAAPDTPLAKLNLLPADERDLLLNVWTNTATDYPQDTLIHQWIEAHPAETIAVMHPGGQLTYGDLNQKSNQLAHYLVSKGLLPEMTVGLCVERSPEMLIGIVGILKAGGAYVPIDPDYPTERIDYVVEDAGIEFLVTTAALSDLFIPDDLDIIVLDRKDAFTTQPTTPPQVDIHPHNLAYMIYTSGSTGKPKGVCITHHNLNHSTVARFEYYPRPVERFLLLSSFAFDSSLVGIFWALCAGGTLCLPPHQGERDVQDVLDLIRIYKITHLLALPSLYQVLLEFANPHDVRSVNTVIVAGEACPITLVEQHYQTLPDAELYNEYGPTEGTVWSTVWEIPDDATHMLIGKAIPNVQTYILDQHQQPVPIGIVGELYIGGAGVAQGYHNRPELTAERFIPNPFRPDDGRLYRTGDLARYLPDGSIAFLGRVDFQVKINGYRIELGEIETALASHEAVNEAVVIPINDTYLEDEQTPIMFDPFLLADCIDLHNAEATLAEIENLSDDDVDSILKTLLGD